MPFDWNDFFTLAERLSREADVASKRTAIGRAYYYVFNAALERAELTAGKHPKGTSVHLWCWNAYTNTQDDACRRIGILGDRLHDKRIRMDYKSAVVPQLDTEVARVLAEARSFTQQRAALDPRFPRP